MGNTSVATRAVTPNKTADVMEQNLPYFALAKTWDYGKPIGETTAADLPLSVDTFRHFLGAVRAREDYP
jgi:aldehyde dehydrogenase